MSLWVWLSVVSAAVIAVNSADGFILVRDNEPADRRGIVGAVVLRTVIDVTVSCAAVTLFYAMLH